MCLKLGKIVLVTLFFFSCLNTVVFGKENKSDIQNEIKELRQEQETLHKELNMVRDILIRGRRPMPTQAKVSGVEFGLGNNPVVGKDSAPLVVVEFSDYQCPFCERNAKETYPKVFNKYIKTGKVRYVFMDKPLPSHDKANEAAEAVRCATEQGKFWKMHEKMFSDPDSVNDLTGLASSLGLDIKKFKSCVEKQKYSGKIAADLSLANRLDVPSVPGFVIASRDPSNPEKVKGISYIRGAQPFTQFEMKIDRALASFTNPEWCKKNCAK